MMRDYQHTMAGDYYGPGQYVENAADELKRPTIIQVVSGDNKELSWHWTLFATIAWVSVMAVPIYGMRMQADWEWGRFFIFWGLGSLLGIPGILFIASGDIAVLRQIGRTAKLEEFRLDKAAKIAKKHQKLEKQIAVWKHEENMARIVADAELTEVRVQLQALQDNVRLLPTHDDGIASPSYTPAEVTPARRMARDYARSLYHRGVLDETKVDPKTGRIKGSVPWSKRGAWKGADSMKAYEVLVSPAGGAPPLIREEHTDGQVTGYYFNLEHYHHKGDIDMVIGLV